MPSHSWGVIYCPKKNSFSTRRRWKKILRCLNEKALPFDYVQSEDAASVERLAAMMTRAGYSTIVVVGGDSALNYALCGIMSTQSPSGKHPVLGVIPNGIGNDFARYWGLKPENFRKTIDGLALYHTRKIDVGIALITTTKGAKKKLYFLNCVNLGIAAAITKTLRTSKRLLGFRTLSRLFSSLLLLFQRMSFKFGFHLSGEDHRQSAMGVCIGSAHGYGQTPSAVPYNGLLDVTLVAKPAFFQMFQGLWLLFTRRFLSHRGVKVWRTRNITFTNVSGAPMSVDGRLFREKPATVDVSILPEEIEFLIPQFL